MKILKLLFQIITVVILLSSCHESNYGTIYFHLQNEFNNDSVIIKVDGNVIYDKDSVTTNNLLGLADVGSSDQQKGYRDIELIVNNLPIHSATIHFTHSVYVGIMYYPSDTMAIFQFSEEPFLYE